MDDTGEKKVVTSDEEFERKDGDENGENQNVSGIKSDRNLLSVKNINKSDSSSSSNNDEQAPSFVNSSTERSIPSSSSCSWFEEKNNASNENAPVGITGTESVQGESSVMEQTMTSDSNDGYCRICCDHESVEPYIDLGCQCRGDIALIHESCLRKYFKTRPINLCDVCRTPMTNIPFSVIIDAGNGQEQQALLLLSLRLVLKVFMALVWITLFWDLDNIFHRFWQ